MRRIQFKASFGHEYKDVELYSGPGAGGLLWHLYVNRFYWGQISPRQGKWVVLLQRPPGWFTKADMDIICDLIEEAMEWPDQRA